MNIRGRSRLLIMLRLQMVIALSLTAVPSLMAAPAYSINAIPPQTAWHGETLDFIVQPGVLGVGATLSYVANPVPQGVITFEAASGRFTFTPGANDRQPFTVMFRAERSGRQIAQAVDIEPRVVLPRSRAVFGQHPTRPLPATDSIDYLTRTERLNPAESFNYVNRQTRTVEIAGKTVVFRRGHPSHLFEDYDNVDDLKELVIYAETLVIGNALRLPQTMVQIYARELRFEDPAGTNEKASISTTPRSLTTLPAQFLGGVNGLSAGNLELHVEHMVADSGAVRLESRGGDGQAGGAGRPGNAGSDLTNLGAGDWPDGTTYVEGTQCTAFAHPQVWDCSELRAGDNTRWPGDGEAGVAGGKPGDGGAGGQVVSNIPNLDSRVDNGGGRAGNSAGPQPGGRGGNPRHAFRIKGNLYRPNYHWPAPQVLVSIIAEHFSTDGNVTETPAGIQGGNGAVVFQPSMFKWCSSSAVHSTVAHAKDAYLYGHFSSTRAILTDYAGVLDAYAAAPEWSDLPAESQVELVKARQEIEMLLHRLDSNLDYFGNPIGWAPRLSFEFTKALYEGEINQALRVLYLGYWLRNSVATVDQRVAAMEITRTKLRDEVADFRGHYNDAILVIPELEQQTLYLSNRVEQLQAHLGAVENRLAAQAQSNVKKRHKVSGWRKTLKVAGSILNIAAVKYPPLGAVGTGLGIIADYDSSDPLRTVGELAKLSREFSSKKLKEGANTWDQFVNSLNLDQLQPGGWNYEECKTVPLNCVTNFVNGQMQVTCDSTVECNMVHKGPKDFIKQLEVPAKSLAAGYKTMRELNKKTEVPQNEVEAELFKLRDADPEFRAVVDDLLKFTAEKEVFQKKLADTIQLIGTLQDGITQNLLGIDALNGDLPRLYGVLDARAISYVKEMERRARERLLKYHYFLAKAYEYRLLEAYTGELKLTEVVDRVAALVAAGMGHDLDSTEFNNLKAVFEERLSSIAVNIVDRFIANGPERANRLTVRIPTNELVRLAPGQPLSVSMKRLAQFLPSRENLRIVNLRVARVVPRFAAGEFMFGLHIKHSGVSRLYADGQEYEFFHYSQNTRTLIDWSGIFEPGFGFTHDQPSDATSSLLYSLLPEGKRDKILLFARPAVWSDFDIELETLPGDDGLRLDALDLELTYDFGDRANGNVSLDVLPVAAELQPQYALSLADIGGYRDGQGDFRRTYRVGQMVTMTAPVRYGSRKLANWTVRKGASQTTVTSAAVTLVLDADATVLANYEFVEDEDSDEDGLPDEWELLYFGTLVFSELDDNDHDTDSNVTEFNLGQNPIMPEPIIQVRRAGVNGSLLELTWPTIPGQTYRVQSADWLEPGAWTDVSPAASAPDFSLSISVGPSGESKFFRILSP